MEQTNMFVIPQDSVKQNLWFPGKLLSRCCSSWTSFVAQMVFFFANLQAVVHQMVVSVSMEFPPGVGFF